MAVLTFSRTYGCGVRELGRGLANELDYMYFEKELIPLIFKKIRETKTEQKEHRTWTDSLSGAMIDFICTAFPFIRRGALGEDLFANSLKEVITGLADKGDVVILGRGSQVILQDYQNAFHIRFTADLEHRINHLQKIHPMKHLSKNALVNTIKEQDKARGEFVKYNFNRDIDDQNLYHLIIDLGETPAAEAKRLIKTLIA